MLSVCKCVGSARVWETWPWGLFLWGVAVPVCFLCPFQPFLLEATWPAGDYIFSPNGVSELGVLGEGSEAMEWLYMSVCMCGGCGCFVCAWQSVSLIAIIVVFVITAECGETPQTDSIWEKDLGTCVHPYLKKQERQRGRGHGNDLLGNQLDVLNTTELIHSSNAVYMTSLWGLNDGWSWIKGRERNFHKFAFNDDTTAQYLLSTELLVSRPCACPLCNMRCTSTGELAIFES